MPAPALPIISSGAALTAGLFKALAGGYVTYTIAKETQSTIKNIKGRGKEKLIEQSIKELGVPPKYIPHTKEQFYNNWDTLLNNATNAHFDRLAMLEANPDLAGWLNPTDEKGEPLLPNVQNTLTKKEVANQDITVGTFYNIPQLETITLNNNYHAVKLYEGYSQNNIYPNITTKGEWYFRDGSTTNYYTTIPGLSPAATSQVKGWLEAGGIPAVASNEVSLRTGYEDFVFPKRIPAPPFPDIDEQKEHPFVFGGFDIPLPSQNLTDAIETPWSGYDVESLFDDVLKGIPPIPNEFDIGIRPRKTMRWVNGAFPTSVAISLKRRYAAVDTYRGSTWGKRKRDKKLKGRAGKIYMKGLTIINHTWGTGTELLDLASVIKYAEDNSNSEKEYYEYLIIGAAIEAAQDMLWGARTKLLKETLYKSMIWRLMPVGVDTLQTTLNKAQNKNVLYISGLLGKISFVDLFAYGNKALNNLKNILIPKKPQNVLVSYKPKWADLYQPKRYRLIPGFDKETFNNEIGKHINRIHTTVDGKKYYAFHDMVYYDINEQPQYLNLASSRSKRRWRENVELIKKQQLTWTEAVKQQTEIAYQDYLYKELKHGWRGDGLYSLGGHDTVDFDINADNPFVYPDDPVQEALNWVQSTQNVEYKIKP